MVKSTDNKDELIKTLVEDYDIEKNTLENKTKKELWDMIKVLESDDLVGDVTESNDEAVKNDTEKEVSPPPLQTDYEWHDYVMGKFHKDELVEGNPTVDGMRRVCELLIGDIFEINSEVIQYPTVENERRATVKVVLGIDCQDGKPRIYNGCADVYYGNADGIYGKHPVALAETRAEGRALKRALKLRKIVSAEEISGDNESLVNDIRSKDPINDNQKMFINLCCSKDRADINVEKFVKSIYPKVRSISDVKYTEAQELVKKLDEYNRKQDSIPEEIKGFDSGWLTNFGG